MLISKKHETPLNASSGMYDVRKKKNGNEQIDKFSLSIHVDWTCLVARMETDSNTDKNLGSF